MPQDESRQLAYEVARALEDMKSLAHHENITREAPREIVQRNLMIALSYQDEDVDRSRAAIYVGLMKRDGYGGRYPRY